MAGIIGALLALSVWWGAQVERHLPGEPLGGTGLRIETYVLNYRRDVYAVVALKSVAHEHRNECGNEVGLRVHRDMNLRAARNSSIITRKDDVPGRCRRFRPVLFDLLLEGIQFARAEDASSLIWRVKEHVGGRQVADISSGHVDVNVEPSAIGGAAFYGRSHGHGERQPWSLLCQEALVRVAVGDELCIQCARNEENPYDARNPTKAAYGENTEGPSRHFLLRLQIVIGVLLTIGGGCGFVAAERELHRGNVNAAGLPFVGLLACVSGGALALSGIIALLN